MSFQGYYQIICENGHLSTCDVYDFEFEVFECPICKGKKAFRNLVDQTNCCTGFDTCPNAEEKKTCCGIGIGYKSFKVWREKRIEKCEHCGLSKVVEHETYKIPNL